MVRVAASWTGPAGLGTAGTTGASAEVPFQLVHQIMPDTTASRAAHPSCVCVRVRVPMNDRSVGFPKLLTMLTWLISCFDVRTGLKLGLNVGVTRQLEPVWTRLAYIGIQTICGNLHGGFRGRGGVGTLPGMARLADWKPLARSPGGAMPGGCVRKTC